jgi:hypothetical protein
MTRTRRRQVPSGDARVGEEGGLVGWAPPGIERGCMGRAWKKWAGRGEGKWAGPEETVKVLIYLNNFPTNLNCFDQKVDLSSSKIYK